MNISVPSNALSDIPSFLKVVTPGFGFKTCIPPSFLTIFRGEYPPQFRLQSDLGNNWQTKLSVENGICFFSGLGWEKFVKDHSPKEGDILVFYLSNSNTLFVRLYTQGGRPQLALFGNRDGKVKCIISNTSDKDEVYGGANSILYGMADCKDDYWWSFLIDANELKQLELPLELGPKLGLGCRSSILLESPNGLLQECLLMKRGRTIYLGRGWERLLSLLQTKQGDVGHINFRPDRYDRIFAHSTSKESGHLNARNVHGMYPASCVYPYTLWQSVKAGDHTTNIIFTEDMKFFLPLPKKFYEECDLNRKSIKEIWSQTYRTVDVCHCTRGTEFGLGGRWSDFVKTAKLAPGDKLRLDHYAVNPEQVRVRILYKDPDSAVVDTAMESGLTHPASEMEDLPSFNHPVVAEVPQACLFQQEGWEEAIVNTLNQVGSTSSRDESLHIECEYKDYKAISIPISKAFGKAARLRNSQKVKITEIGGKTWEFTAGVNENRTQYRFKGRWRDVVMERSLEEGDMIFFDMRKQNYKLIYMTIIKKSI